MSFIKKIWGLKVLVFGLVLSCGLSLSMAGEDQPLPKASGTVDSSATEESAVSFETEGEFFLGYRGTLTEDSLKAAEFIYPHSSITFGLDLLSAPLPYRYHAHGEFFSRYDYYLDAGFAYDDLVLLRDILVGVRHKKNHYFYPVDGIHFDNNPADHYYTDYFRNLVSLRLKAPDFPFHIFVNHHHVARQGKNQQRFLLNYFDDPKKISETRDIDWKSNAVKLGANSHLGPIEIEYAFDHAEFDPGGNNILRDLYTYPAYPFLAPTGNYPHNVIPETESSAHSIKMHSSYTGGVVAAATISNLLQKNNFSLTESTTWKGAFDFSWIPGPAFGAFFKYRHKNVDMDTPGAVYLNGYNGDKTYYNSLPPVRQGISYSKDVFSLSTRYKPVNILSLHANYEFSHLERKDIADWELLPGRSNIHTVNLTANARPVDRLKVKAIFEYKHFDQETYNTTPENSNKLKLTTAYTPSSDLTIYMQYLLVLTEGDSLSYDDIPGLLERDGQRAQFLASITKGITPKLSLTASWFYQRLEVEQDIAFDKVSTDVPPYFIDLAVPYTDKANSFSLSLHWVPRDDFTVGADLSHTIVEGTTGYNVAFDGVSLSTLSDLEASETSFSLNIAKKLPKDWEIGLKLYLDIYNDKPTGTLDGNLFSSTVTMKRNF